MKKMMMILILLAVTIYSQTIDPSIESEIDVIISRMTLEEKAAMLGGDTTGFDSKPLERLGIPALRMTDGPNGVRWREAMALPVGVCMAATWDTSLVYELAAVLGRETKANGRNVLLGPCINIHRDPRAGRNFESFGEDPFLTSRIAVAYIKGLQSENVIATTKHFACNNQEFERNSMDSRVDERTIREIYLPAFKAAVQEGNTWAIMSSYNRINGHYASSNTWLLKTLLKEEWGFKGFVMSDWGAVHSIVPTMYAGLDIEMPNSKYLSVENVVKSLNDGRMKESKVDDKVRRMLRAMYTMELFEKEIPDGGTLNTEQHQEIARQVAAEGMVLLKNENDQLPLTKEKVKSIAVIGPNADNLQTGGGGSSRVTPINPVSPYDALKELADGIDIIYETGIVSDNSLDIIPTTSLQTIDGTPGLTAEYFKGLNFDGEPVVTRTDKTINFSWGSDGPIKLGREEFSIRWTGNLTADESGDYILATTSDDGSRIFINDELIVDNWGNHGTRTRSNIVKLAKGVPVNIKVEFYEDHGGAEMRLQWQKAVESPITRAVEAAEKADAVVLCIGFSSHDESEGFDRASNALPKEQIDLLNKIYTVNKNLTVVFSSGAGILMNDWASRVPAILETWYPGEQGGYAIADILLGNVSPSGKLVTTFFKEEKDLPTINNYPGEDDKLNYEEGIFVGYRHYDRYNIAPLFPFGHGLSYTTFEYSDLKLSDKSISQGENLTAFVTLKNTGNMAGSEVVQLYINDNKSSVIRPEKELKSFSKIKLVPGETKTVALNLSADALKFWDIGTDSWIAEPGKFTIMVGASSRDIRLTEKFTLK